MTSVRQPTPQAESVSGQTAPHLLRSKATSLARYVRTLENENIGGAPLRPDGSLTPDSRPLQALESRSLHPSRPIPLPRDLDAPESEAKSNPREEQLGAAALPKKFPWQVRATTLITIFGPPTASLILLAVDYFEYWRAVPFNLGDFLAAFFLFAIPRGYAFGTGAALLAAFALLRAIDR